MRAILPGRPNATRQALSTANWDGLRLVSYVSGNTVVVLDSPHHILQTLYTDEATTLHAVVLDETSGRLATCGDSDVYIYEPRGREEDSLRWTLLRTLEYGTQGRIYTLSWGSSEELLIAGSEFQLWNFQQAEDPQLIWQQEVSSEIELACMSHDAGIIASFAKYDRFVKVWRRLSYEVDSTRFDVSYLSHPAAIINVQWRKPWHAEQILDNLLYTFCTDQQIRVWDYADSHSLSVMQLVATIDTRPSIQPRRLSTGSMSQRRYAFIIDSRDFAGATERAVQTTTTDGTDHALEHLIEVANRTPDVCVIMDGLGHMSAWGIENIGSKSQQSPTTFNIVHVDGMNLRFPQKAGLNEDFVGFCTFAGGHTECSLSLLLHSHDGQIDWYDAQLKHMLDTAHRDSRVTLLASWAGHDSTVSVINWHQDVLLSWTDQGQLLVWKHEAETLSRQSSIHTEDDIVDAVPFRAGAFVAILTSSSVDLWDCQRSPARLMSSARFPVSAHPVFLLLHNEAEPITSNPLIDMVCEDGSCIELSVHLPQAHEGHTNGVRKPLDVLGPHEMNLPIRSPHIIRARASTQQKRLSDSAVALARDGSIYCLERPVVSSVDSEYRWTEVQQCVAALTKLDFASTNTRGKVAFVTEGGRLLRIWSLDDGLWEFVYRAEGSDSILGVSWHCTEFDHALALVWSSFQVVIFSQKKFGDGANSLPWVEMYRIRTRDFTTRAIGAASWSKDGDIIIGAGNQLFVLDTTPTRAGTPGSTRSLSSQPQTLVQALDTRNALLPIFHHTFLHHLLDVSGTKHIRSILQTLHQNLKFFSEGDNLNSFLDLGPLSILGPSPKYLLHDSPDVKVYTNGSTTPDEPMQEEVLETLLENVTRHRLWQLPPSAQQKLQSFIALFPKVDAHSSSLDANALRYLRALYTSTPHSPLPWSAILFASLSTTQEPLLALINSHYSSSKLSWPQARSCGLFSWLSPDNPETLSAELSLIAQTEYTTSSDDGYRNPVDCSLYYLALRKKSVLQGLWRMTIGVREKDNTVKLLANNFDLPRWKATAMKNAYALLSKRRFEYAAAWFLLGDSLKDAVNVCLHQLDDLQLAIAIARVYGGDHNNPVLTTLLRDSVLNAALKSNEGRAMACWAYLQLHDPVKALQVLVRPVWQVVLDTTDPSKMAEQIAARGITEEQVLPSLHYTVNDPLIALVYVQIREMLVKQGRWGSRSTSSTSSRSSTSSTAAKEKPVLQPGEEARFVMRCARYYVRMGCDLLGLDLVRSWEFVEESESQRMQDVQGHETESDDGGKVGEVKVVEKEEEMMKEVKEKKKPAPTQFVEPASSDLLDSFGF